MPSHGIYRNYQNPEYGVPIKTKPSRRAYHPKLVPPGKSVHRWRVIKQAPPEEHQDIGQRDGDILHGGTKDHKYIWGSSRIWNGVVTPSRHSQYPLPIKRGREIPLDLKQHWWKKFPVYFPKGEVRSFGKCDRGLFYSNMAFGQGTVILNTVGHNKYKYSKYN